jgi:hypothetical protein
MSERGTYLPLTWNDEVQGMGVYLPPSVQDEASKVEPEHAGIDFEHPLYLVETISTFRMRYVVSAKSAEHAADTVTMEEAEEMSQKHIDENILSMRQISRAEYLQIFNEDNDYLRSWDADKKFDMVHVVDYDSNSN